MTIEAAAALARQGAAGGDAVLQLAVWEVYMQCLPRARTDVHETMQHVGKNSSASHVAKHDFTTRDNLDRWVDSAPAAGGFW